MGILLHLWCSWLQVLDAAACAELGMGCYLGVAEASLQPPAFIHLTYKPQGEAKKKVRSVDMLSIWWKD
jgi:leucyl aminopeptidase